MQKLFVTLFACCVGAVLVVGQPACSSGGGETADGGSSDGGSTQKSDGGTTGTTDGGSGWTNGKKPGSACTKDEECMGPNGKCITSVQGGTCVIFGCEIDEKLASCPTGSFCIAFNSQTNACVEGPCSSDADCSRKGDGYVCDADQSCWNYSYVPTNPGKAAVGAACQSEDDCESGTCIGEKDENGDPTGYVGGYCSYECDDNAAQPCPSGSTCDRGLCRKQCQQTGDCRTPGYACVSGLCKRDPGLVNVGKACSDNGACGWGECLTAESSAHAFPGGYCSATDDCDNDSGAGCGPGAKCLTIYGSDQDGNPLDVPFCAKTCSSDGDCRTSEGYACDAAEHVCLRAKTPDPTKIKLGASCLQDSDCNGAGGSNGVCFKQETADGQTYWKNGYCAAYSCTEEDVDNNIPDSCGAGGVCSLIGEAPDAFCFKKCSSDADCRTAEGYSCDPTSHLCMTN